jgi:hypothetical protein
VLLASERWFEVAWGTSFTPERRAREEERLECLWGALEETGVDPISDFECLERHITAAADCQAAAVKADDPVRDCTRAYESACALSPGFDRLATHRCPPLKD